MGKEKKVRSIWLTIRLNEDEDKKIQKHFEKTTANSLSSYARRVLLQEPVTVLYRSESADNFLAEMIQLKNELNAIGNNFNQAVRKLHTLDDIHEIKSWLLRNDPAKEMFLQKTGEIKEKLTQIYQQWSQS